MIARLGTGYYRVSVPGCTTSGGHVQVTAYGSGSEHCKVASWGVNGVNQDVLVRCFNAAGAAVDTTYTMQLTTAARTELGRNVGPEIAAGYVWAGNPTALSYTPSLSYQWNSTGAANTVTRNTTGSYTVRFAGLGGRYEGNVQVTAYGNGSEYCKASGWTSNGTSQDVSVRCFTAAGIAADAAFTASFSTRPPVGGGFVYAEQPAAASYTPTATYQRNYLGTPNTISRTGIGTYSVSFPSVAAAGGTVLVTAYGTGSERCKVAGWSPVGSVQRATVRCFTAAGAPVDTRFSARYIRGVQRDSRPFRIFQSTTTGVQSAIWEGQLVLPDLARESVLVEGHRADGSSVWWYRNSDGSYSKGLVNLSGKLVGVMTLARDRFVLGLDVDGDRLLDVYRDSSLDRTLTMFDELRGRLVTDDILAGMNPLCREEMGVGSPLLPGGPTADSRATLGCSASPAGGSGSSGSDPVDNLTSSQDPLEPLCEQVLSHPRPCDGGLTEDGEGTSAAIGVIAGIVLEKIVETSAVATRFFPAVGAFVAVTFDAAGTGASCEFQGDGACQRAAERRQTQAAVEEAERMQPYCTSQNVCVDNGETESTDTTDESTDPTNQSTAPAPTPSPGTSYGGCTTSSSTTTNPDDDDRDAEALIYDTCLRSMRLGRPRSIQDLYVAAVQTDCLAPVVNPSPYSDPNFETRTIRCLPTREGSYVTSIDGLLGRGGLNGQCGINERPGVDGRCSAYPTNMGSAPNGIAWVSLGETLGINTCDPQVCNP